MEDFSIWLEFEQYAGGYPGPDDDPLCDFCNVLITVGASRYAINVWTFAFFEQARREDPVGRSLVAPARYLVAPDLFVERLDRATITHAISEIMAADGLPQLWRVENG